MTIPAYNPVPVTNANIVTFITTDPLGVGFAAIRSASPGADTPLLTPANAAGVNYQVPSDPITASALLDLIDAGEFSTMTTAQLTQLQTILDTQTVSIGGAAAQAKLNSLLASYAKSLAAVQAKYTRNGSPWEYYFGAGQVATVSQLDAARNSGSGNNF